jgi:GH25 family lysozyme M1 (1,4-beta-N-acetylmuramidase)
VGLLTLGLYACDTLQGSKETAPPYESPYDWGQLYCNEETGRYSYYEDGNRSSRFGIDVSEHQGFIDWGAVASDGVEFAFIRLGNRGATEGRLYLDNYFEANFQGAQSNGILTGIYFFSQAINEDEAREEAEFVLEHLAGRSLDYPIVFDHEPVSGFEARTDHLTGEQVSLFADAFFEVIREADYDVMIYGNQKDLLRLDGTLLNRVGVWFAEYDVARPTIQRDILIWQYTSSGSVEGISTRVDMNIHFVP